MNLRVAKELRANKNPEDGLPGIEVELLKLVITRIAEFWRFGSLVLSEISAFALFRCLVN